MIVRSTLMACLTLTVAGCTQGTPITVARSAGEPSEADWIQRICVDQSGKLDQNIASGYWPQKDWDMDLNGDGVPERVVVFYPWPKWGSAPEEAAGNFDKSNAHDHGIGDVAIVNAILIFERRAGHLVPAAYFFKDEDGTELVIERSSVSGLPFLACGGGPDEVCHAWGAASVGGRIGPLDGAKSTHYGLSQTTARFAVRSGYPQ